jgi:hypothetical protein
MIIIMALAALLAAVGRPAGAQDATPTPSPTAAADLIVDWRYGVVESYEAPGHARNLGAAWTRVRFQWAEMQGEGPQSWNPPVSDEVIAEQEEAGRLIVGLLIGIPEWARDENDLPRGLYEPIDSAANTWAGFVREIVARYAGTIDHWVIWNEPDIWDETALGHTWDGSEADFARLLKVAYLVAHEVNDDVVIHLPAFTYFWDFNYGREQYLGRLLDAILADPDAVANNYYFDVMTAHLYFNPDRVYNIIREFEEIRAAKGIPHKPLWLMETNAPPVDDPRWPVQDVTLSVTLGEQAFYMPQVLAAGLAAGAERIAIYKLKDNETDREANPEPFGLVRDDGTRRPAFDAYRTAMEFLSNVETTTVERWDAVGQIRVEQPDRTTTVLFSRLPAEQTATVDAIAEQAFLVDTFNSRRIFLEPEDDAFTVTLPPAPCTQSIGDYCMIGGETFYLVQARDGGPPPVLPPDGAALPPRPTPSPTPAVTNTPEPTATATPAPATATPSPTPTTSFTATPATRLADTRTPTPTPPATAIAVLDPGTPDAQPAGATGTNTPTGTSSTSLNIDASIIAAAVIALISLILLLIGIYRRIIK